MAHLIKTHRAMNKNAHSDPPDQEENEDSVTIDFTSVDLNLNNTKCSNTHNCNTNQNKTIFQPKNGYGFSSVKIDKFGKDPVIIWKSSNDSIYSNNVVFIKYNSEEAEVLIYLTDESVKKFVSFAGGNWTELNLSEITTVGISIESMDDSFAYTNDLDNQFRIFRVREGFIFNCLYELRNYLRPSSKYSTVWEARNETEYANKIIVDGIKLLYYPKKASIFLTNGTVKHFSKKGSAWVEKASVTEIDISSVKETFFYYSYFDNNVRTFSSKTGFSFNKVKSDNTDIWATTNNSEYANKVVFAKRYADKLDVTIHFGEKNKKLFIKESENDPWKEINLTILNPKSFNIDYPYETYFFTNDLNNNFRTFTAKTGFAFISANEFIDDQKIDIWTSSNDNDYANKIEVDLMNNDSKAVTLYFPGNKTKLFMKHNKTEHWTEVDTTKVIFKTMSITDDKETYFCSNKLRDSNRTFEAKTGFAFNKVEDVNTVIWTSTEDTEYAKKVEYAKRYTGILDLTIHMGSGKKKLFIKENENDPWEEIDITIVHPKSVNVDYEDESYFYKNELQGKTRTFKAKTGFIFEGAHEYINNNKVEIWKTDNKSEYINKIVMQPVNNVGGKAVTIHFNYDKTKVFIKSRKYESWTEIDTTEVNPKSVSIQDQDDTYFYTIRFDKGVRTFEAKTGFLFNGVRDDNSDLWTTTNENEYAKKVVSEENKKVIIHSANGSTKVFNKIVGDIWAKDTKASTKGTTIFSETESSSTAYKDYSKIDIYLDILSDKSNDMFDYKRDGQYVTYTAKDNYVFKLVKEGNTNILETTDVTHYSDKVEVDLLNNDAKAVTVFLGDDTRRIFIRSSTGSPWAEFDTSKLNTKTININFPCESYFYKNDLKGNLRTFTSKKGFAFKAANEYVNGNMVEVWQRNKENEYSNMIVNEGGKKVTIYLADGSTRVIKKESEGQWRDDTTGTITVPLHFETTQPRVRLFKVNPSDLSNLLSLSTNEFSSITSGNVVKYQIANGVNCTRLMIDDVLLWEYDSSKYGDRYPRSVYHNTETDILLLRISGVDITFENTAEGWIFTESGPLAVKFHIVDPKDNTKTVELPTTHLTLSESGDMTTFTIADNVDTIALTYGSVILWQHDPNKHSGKHPKSLVYTRSTETLVLKFEGIDITFEKNTEGGWEYTETVTDDRKVESTPPAAQTGASTTKPRVRLFKVNPSDLSNLLSLSTNEFSSITSGNVVKYQIANGVNCTRLMIDDVLLWEYDSSKYGDRYPRSVYHNTETDILLLRISGVDITFENTAEGWIFTESGPLAVKFHIVDPKDNTKTVELPTTHLTLSESGDMTTFTIADNVDTIALTYGSVILWQHDPNKHSGKHPKSLVYTRSTETLVLKFEGIDVTFAKNNEGVWEYTETDTSDSEATTTQPESDGTSEPGEGASTTPPPESSGEGTPATPSAQTGPSTTQPRVRLLKVNPSDPSSLMALGANDVSYSTSGSVVLYKISSGVNCVQLIFDNVLLWLYDPNQLGCRYPESLYHDTSTDVLVLRFPGLDITFEKNTEGGWEYTETVTDDRKVESTPPAAQTGASTTKPRVRLFKVNPSDLSNLLSLSTNEFSSITSGNVVKYQIANGVNCTRLMIDDVLLWEYDSSKYGDRYPRSVYHNTETDILLLRISGVDITFENTAEGWIFTESGPLAVKFHIVDPKDNTKTVELPTTHLTLSESGDMTTFTIADNVDTIALTYGSVILWQHDPNKHSGKHPNSLYYIKSTDTLVLRFEGLDIAYAKNTQGVWEYTETDTSDREADNVISDGTSSLRDRAQSVEYLVMTYTYHIVHSMTMEFNIEACYMMILRVNNSQQQPWFQP
ncbi:uncharacterized protein TOT_030000883 [Theileria orientalis strain Shintoku]|uniref:Uncharacterized protein n=1 Tax=Theileria orientalis strain Shintoku TaxID=869250 RepID=J4DQ06_THEOR|nr:uncharacterized protein TOT_030000883 [Theileria orientalis strain Shintoku]BAM41619.1 uncharacterized protein TOT_030000883 [Theileria orientalis strain Shintoku]|eukprot:XP_009691920.1 uncharacterized protein TOT_030000883 [Theileria orientalis strain Shintoku]